MEYSPDFLIIPYQLILDEELNSADEKVYAVIYWFRCLKMEKCIASNEVLAKYAKTTPGTVANSLTILEKNGYIKRIFTDKSRKTREEIIPLVSYSAKKVSPTDDTGFIHRLNEVSSTDEQISNSDKKELPSETKVSVDRDISPLKENELLVDGKVFKTSKVNDNGEIVKVSQGKKYPNAHKVFALFNNYPLSWKKMPAQLQSAENLIATRTIEQMQRALDFFNENKLDPFCPKIFSPYDLELKWKQLANYKEQKNAKSY